LVFKPLRVHLAFPALLLFGAFALGAQPVGPGTAATASPRPGLTAETADLVIRGKTAGGAPLLLDLAAIMTLPARSFTSLDPWDGKQHRFTGATLAAVLERAGIDPSAARVTVTARNGYSIPIRRADWEKYEYLLAWAIDDHLFAEDPATRNRGPLSLAIDFSRWKELDPTIYKHQLVWQAKDILVE
jgi:hypothetical protein